MSRVNWKGPYIKKNLFKNTFSKNSIKEIKSYSRESIITPSFIGLNFSIHNGKSFLKFKITDEMIGHKFGEFSPTRKKFTFKKKKNK